MVAAAVPQSPATRKALALVQRLGVNLAQSWGGNDGALPSLCQFPGGQRSVVAVS